MRLSASVGTGPLVTCRIVFMPARIVIAGKGQTIHADGHPIIDEHSEGAVRRSRWLRPSESTRRMDKWHRQDKEAQQRKTSRKQLLRQNENAQLRICQSQSAQRWVNKLRQWLRRKESLAKEVENLYRS